MHYPGTELELFRHAVNWKRYWSSVVKPYVSGRVLDVGSGIGTNAEYLWSERVGTYTFLEPDAHAMAEVEQRVPKAILARSQQLIGTTADLADVEFDCILYIDVLEHIADPVAELQRARDHLAPGGTLIILVPAYQFLFSPFDASIGHFRRYDRSMLREQLPDGLETTRMDHLDGLGVLLSLGNRLLLRKSVPTSGQIAFWDRRIIPWSRRIDRLLGRRIGRSLVAVLRKR